LRRATEPTLSAERVRIYLVAAIQTGVAPDISDEGLRQSPLAIWVSIGTQRGPRIGVQKGPLAAPMGLSR
jgi:hypothetical protein